MTKGYAEFFERITGNEPYPYQERIGTEDWPDFVEVPTGLGKTAAIVIAWMWKCLQGDASTPRRLVYCLPMRVLVEQTATVARGWADVAEDTFDTQEMPVPGVHSMMGGDVDASWELQPEDPAILVGTQDMLLSRALLRGYGMSRYQWPVHFAFLHNDAFWVYDEIQLMGPALATSAQLEGFRRSAAVARPARSLWMSATLAPEWLGTVDFRPHLESAARLTIDAEDRKHVSGRVDAVKRLQAAPVRLNSDSARRKSRAYIADLASAVRAAHREGTQTLVILNQVSRAQALFRRLTSGDDSVPVLLLHGRFRQEERRRIEVELQERSGANRIVVATQAVEAGVDVSSATLFTELAPWSSLVQRFGRCNRYGEVDVGADIYWIDISAGGDHALPYDEETLDAAREKLREIESAGIDDLPRVDAPADHGLVLRRRDFTELFDTEPDLSGFDLDVSPYIRDPGSPQVQVFWRDSVGEGAADEDIPGPVRRELCRVSMGQFRDYMKKTVRKRKRPFWRWDSLSRSWVRSRSKETPRPGEVVMLRADLGGYDDDIGFDPDHTGQVEDLGPDDGDSAEDMGAADESFVGRFISIEEHTRHVVGEVNRLATALELSVSEAELLSRAALWHDVGKAHPAFQTALLDYRDERERSSVTEGTMWAKSSGRGRLRYRMPGEEGDEEMERRHFRHELPSMLAWLAHGEGDDLVSFLIAAHHGRIRLALRSLPDESPAPGGRRFARGVWEGDVVPAVRIDGTEIPATETRLELMELGRGTQGPSWTERTHRLLDEHGPFRLAWLESLLRVADRRASAEERREESGRSRQADAAP